MALAIRVSTDDFQGTVPQGPGTTPWFWDLPKTMVAAIAPYGPNRKIMYCPCDQYQNADELWEGAFSGTVDFRLTGSYWLTQRAARAPALPRMVIVDSAYRPPHLLWHIMHSGAGAAFFVPKNSPDLAAIAETNYRQLAEAADHTHLPKIELRIAPSRL